MNFSNWTSTQKYEKLSGSSGEFIIDVNSVQKKREFTAYLGAALIPFELVERNDQYYFIFKQNDYPYALQEWKHYRKELETLSKQKNSSLIRDRFINKEDYKYSILSTMFVLVGLVYFFVMLRDNSNYLNWLESGAANNTRILSGEFFRTVTALSLHANLGHLLGNTLGLLVFTPLLIKETGAGWGWLLALLSGITGNYINAEFHSILSSNLHVSIGASTLLFGILGLLGSKRIRSGWKTNQKVREALIIPVLAMFALLAIMGVSGQSTDIFAHLFGMLSGMILGTSFGHLDKYKFNIKFQSFCWFIFFGIITFAWIKWSVVTKFS